jgi:hypothetical protein
LEAVCTSTQTTFYIGALRGKLVLACQEVLKLSMALYEPHK